MPPHNPGAIVRRLITHDRRLLSGILVAAFTLVLFADCARAADATAVEKACCAAMGKACGPHSNAHSCCRTEAPRLDQSAAAQRITVASPVSVVVSIAIDLPRTSLTSRANAAALDHHGGSPPRSVPQYVLNSLFRV